MNWALKLSKFDFKIVHISSKNNGISDCLSRLHGNIKAIFEIEPVLSRSEILDSQMKDECMKHAISYLHSKSNSDIDKLGPLRRYRKHLNTDEFGFLCRRNKMVIPKNLRSYILQVAHDHPTSGHFVEDRTSSNITAHYFWSSLRNDIINCVMDLINRFM